MTNQRPEWQEFKETLVLYHAALDGYRTLTENWFKIKNHEGSNVSTVEVLRTVPIDDLVDAVNKVDEARLVCAQAIIDLRTAFAASVEVQDGNTANTGQLLDEDLLRQAKSHDTPLLDELKRVEERYFGGPLIRDLPKYISDAELNELLDIYTTFSLVRQRYERTKSRGQSVTAK